MGAAQPLPLSWLAVDQYARAAALDADGAHILHGVMRGLDADWLRRTREEIGRAAKAAAAQRGKER